MPFCIARKCGNMSGEQRKSKRQRELEKTRKISFHRLPKNQSKREKWLQSLGIFETQAPTAMVCSMHFQEEAFDRTSLSCVRLRDWAIPHTSVELENTSLNHQELDNTSIPTIEPFTIEDIKPCIEEINIKPTIDSFTIEDIKPCIEEIDITPTTDPSTIQDIKPCIAEIDIKPRIELSTIEDIKPCIEEVGIKRTFEPSFTIEDVKPCIEESYIKPTIESSTTEDIKPCIEEIYIKPTTERCAFNGELLNISDVEYTGIKQHTPVVSVNVPTSEVIAVPEDTNDFTVECRQNTVQETTMVVDMECLPPISSSSPQEPQQEAMIAVNTKCLPPVSCPSPQEPLNKTQSSCNELCDCAHNKILRNKLEKANNEIEMLRRRIKSFENARNNAKSIVNEELRGIAGALFHNKLKNQNRPAVGQRYSDAVKKFALTLNYYSPQAYNYCRRIFNLPHTNAIRSWTSSVNSKESKGYM